MLMADVAPGLVQTDWLTFSDPLLRDDIIYQNRSFFWLNYDDPATPNFIETGSMILMLMGEYNSIKTFYSFS